MARGLRFTAEQAAAMQRRTATPAAGIARPAKRPKFGNTKTETKHGNFDSGKEARRYEELVLLERAGSIAHLRRQVPFALVVNGIHVCDYVADAVYREGARLVVEDTKSVATRKERTYRLKVKLMLAVHGIDVKET